MGSVGEPLLLQRERQGRGAAPRSVDEVEVNFIEREGARLLDHALVGSRDTLAWCRERGRALPAGARVAPLPLGAARGPGPPPRAKGGRAPPPPVELVLVVQGRGGGSSGSAISAGGEAQANGGFYTSEEGAYDFAAREAGLFCDVYSELLGSTAATLRGVARVTFWFLGREGDALAAKPGLQECLRAAAAQGGAAAAAAAAVAGDGAGEGRAGGRAGGLPWRVHSGPAEGAVAYLGGAGRAGIVDAGLVRGETTETFLRQLLHARPGEGAAAGTEAGPLLFAVPPWARGRVGELVQERCHSGSLVERDAAALVRVFERQAGEPGNGCPAGALDEAALAEETARWLEGLPAQSQPARAAGAEDRARLPRAVAARVGWLALQGAPARAGQPPPGGGTPGNSPGLEQALATVARPKVSVVITHYNRPELLPLAIRSVAEQTWPGSHLELVVIDDGSPDPEVQNRLDEIEAEFRFQERGWRLLREPNRYLGGAWNAALKNATGEYVLFMDDDSYATPLEVEFFARAAENAASDVLTSGPRLCPREGGPAARPAGVRPQAPVGGRGRRGALALLRVPRREPRSGPVQERLRRRQLVPPPCGLRGAGRLNDRPARGVRGLGVLLQGRLPGLQRGNGPLLSLPLPLHRGLHAEEHLAQQEPPPGPAGVPRPEPRVPPRRAGRGGGRRRPAGGAPAVTRRAQRPRASAARSALDHPPTPRRPRPGGGDGPRQFTVGRHSPSAIFFKKMFRERRGGGGWPAGTRRGVPRGVPQ